MTDFLIDNSDKMDKKTQTVQSVLIDELIPNFDFSSVFGMRTFKSVGGSAIVIKQLDLKEKNDKGTFMEKAQKMPMASGGCPLAVALKESMEELNSNEVETKKIFLITAGEDTDGGLPEYEVEKAAKNIQINIIGIGMDDVDLHTATKIAQMTGGVCCNIPADQLNNNSAIKEIVAPAVEALKNDGKVAIQPSAPAKPVVVEEKVIEEKKEEPKAAPKTETAPQPQIAQTKVELPKINNSSASSIQSSVVEKTEHEVFDAEAEAKATADNIQIKIDQVVANVTSQLNELCKCIPSLVSADLQTIQRMAKSNDAIKDENLALRQAEDKNIKSIEELKKINEEATATISQLMQVIEDQRHTEEHNKKIVEEIAAERKNAADQIELLTQTIEQKDKEIAALEANKAEMQAAIDDLIGKLSVLRQ